VPVPVPVRLDQRPRVDKERPLHPCWFLLV
jgi:hypothetical protein